MLPEESENLQPGADDDARREVVADQPQMPVPLIQGLGTSTRQGRMV